MVRSKAPPEKKRKRKTRKERDQEAAANRQRLTTDAVALSPAVQTKKYWWDAGGIVLGTGATLMLSDLTPAIYWLGLAGVYAGLVALWYHLWVDPKGRILARWATAVLVVGLIAFWSVAVVFVSTPLRVSAYADLGNYPQGTIVGEVSWSDPQHFVDVRLDLTNGTDYNYRDVEMQVNSDITTLAVVQLTQIPGVNFSPEDVGSPIGAAWLGGTGANGEPVHIPMPQGLYLGRPTGYRILCDKFPKHSTIKLMLISAALNYGPPPLPKQLFGAKRLPTFVRIRGQYRAVGRERSIDTRVSVSPIPQ